MPTAIGILFFVASIYCFFKKDDQLFALLIFSALFQASSVIALVDKGVEPYYLVGSMFVLQIIYRRLLTTSPWRTFKGEKWMILFATLAIVSAFTLPFVFAGIPVYEQHVGIDDGFFIRPPLAFRNANLTHSLSLLLGVLVVIGAAQCVRGRIFSRNAYMFTFYFLVAIIAVQFLCSITGIPFPYEALQNHAGRSMQIVDPTDFASRYAGTFTESSGVGAVLIWFTVGFLAERLKFGRSLIPALMGLSALLLARSSAALAAITVVIVLLSFWHPVFRLPFYINVLRLRRVGLLLVLGGVLLGLVIFSPLRNSLIEVTLQKQESGSFINRIASDAYALDLFVMTKGVGVGMGSNRPSSLITSLLSTVGLLGLVVFLMAYFKLLSNAARKHPDLLWAGLGFFLFLVLSGPDYDNPWVWVFLAYVVQTAQLSEVKELAASATDLPVLSGLRA
jgi:hypothetical protein